MDTVLTLTTWIGLGLICMVMAEKRGRNKTLGFVAGLFFGVFAILYYWAVGDTQEMKDKKLAEQIARVDSLRKNK